MKVTEITRRMLRAAAAALTAGILFFLPGLPAGADVIYEPEDEFYAEHSKDCTKEEKTWETNAYGGIRMLAEPDSDEIVYEFNEPGIRMWVYYIYHNPKGGEWAYTEYYHDGNFYKGWLPTNLLWRSYSTESFLRDYGGDITEEQNLVNGENGEDTVYFYLWPGSTIAEKVEFTDGGLQNEPVGTYLAYTDEKGRKWGYVDYWYGHYGWICLETPDLAAEDLWPEGAPERDSRERTVLDIVYLEDSTEIKEHTESSSPTAGSSEKEETETASSSLPVGSSEKEETEAVKTRDADESTEETAGPLPGPAKSLPLWAIPAAAGTLLAVTAAILLAVLIKKKNH